VEQNRTLVISVYQYELERGAFDRLSNGCGFDKKYQDPDWSECSMPVRYEQARVGRSNNR
jgi:hypothetical protein